MRSRLLTLFFFLLSLLLPVSALASTYGEGSFGEGSYNIGDEIADDENSPAPKSGSSDTSSNERCSAPKPVDVPDLFEIDPTTTSLVLYFTPVNDHRDRYFVSYSTSESAEEHGFEFANRENGVVAVTVGDLEVNMTYYFKVRAGNDCQPGDWSNVLAATTGQYFPTYRWSSLTTIVSTGVTRIVNPSAIQRFEANNSPAEPVNTDPQQSDIQETTSPDSQAPAPPSADEKSSLLGRLNDFFKRLLGI